MENLSCRFDRLSSTKKVILKTNKHQNKKKKLSQVMKQCQWTNELFLQLNNFLSMGSKKVESSPILLNKVWKNMLWTDETQ